MVTEKFISSRLFAVLLHVSVWVVIFILPLFFESNVPPPLLNINRLNREDFRLLSTLMNLSFIPLFYLNAFLFVPRFFNKKNWLTYILFTIATITLIILLNVWLRYAIVRTMPPFPVRIIVLIGSFMLITSTAFSFLQQHLKVEKFRKEREAENLKTELSFLRSQVSPHFLFNTLNNLVSLARKKSDLLELHLMKLSGLLQYMLYESDDEKISIHKEIEYISNYIELQKLRTGSDVKIDFLIEVPGNSTKEVVPMVLIPFVENAFKHGIGLIEEPEISIRFILAGDVLTFSVRNKFNAYNEEKDSSSGIGLSNVRRRLSLLYPNSQLKINTDGNWHVVNLTIII